MDELLIEQRGAAGLITLNRPQALNALSVGMIDGLARILTEWENNETVRIVFLAGAGRAFCAGGDIKAVYRLQEAGNDPGHALAMDYFRREYALDSLIHHYKKPIVALMHGIVMGGGYGLAGQCRFRICGSGMTFAMPETGIGFFPDVGSAWHLSRMPCRAGICLGLSGMTIGADDAQWLGIATHRVAQDGLNALVDMPETEIGQFLEAQSQPRGQGVLERHKDLIAKAFTAGDVETALPILEESNSPFAQEVMNTLAKRSPESLRITAAHLDWARDKTFDQVLARDLELARQCLEHGDFHEGIRAALIDRDQAPAWKT